ncbi:MAG: hypothetical protein DME25_05020 [Verrucomicrobia bacterium]|nr:MAG: hypothetical protein DME25_05020 [Verrucomicrobiota bacterium]
MKDLTMKQPERTRFFRDREPFAALSRMVVEKWLPTHALGPLRLLSIPCGCGEEPYSLAMALLDAGLAAHRFCIDAVESNAGALERARRAVYGQDSFGAEDLGFRDRYFERTGEGFVLQAAVRSAVHFYQGNLLDEDSLAGHASYDFIFCRNLLIDLDRPTQRQALEKIHRLLAPSGALFVGPGEQGLVLEHGLVSATIAMAFAYVNATQAGNPSALGAYHA